MSAVAPVAPPSAKHTTTPESPQLIKSPAVLACIAPLGTVQNCGWATSEFFQIRKKLPSRATLHNGRGNLGLWFRLVRDALLQAVSVGAAFFASIDVAVHIEVDMRCGPLWGDIDAMVSSPFPPPVKLHKKAFIWKYVAEVHRGFAGVKTTTTASVNPVLGVPNDSKILCGVL